MVGNFRYFGYLEPFEKISNISPFTKILSLSVDFFAIKVMSKSESVKWLLYTQIPA